jgi:Tfp pilus assembly protein PilE
MARRSGINAFEVIIVIVIIGVLAALLLPSIQSAREAARRPASGSMNETGLAITNFGARAEEKLINDAQVLPGERRKIIYESQLNLVVEDIAATESAIAKLTKDLDGYIAEAAVDRSQGENITARWRLRIPIANFDAFLESVAELGIVENRQQTTQDVTEQFVDLQAQIANKKKLEERIVKLLDNNAGALKDVIEVERELARVRGEIEQMEGRLRYLTNRTDLTTVAVTARVEKNYVPEAAPDLEKRIQTAWETSLEKLQTFGERALVAAVYAGPWIAVAIILLVPACWYISRRRRATK